MLTKPVSTLLKPVFRRAMHGAPGRMSAGALSLVFLLSLPVGMSALAGSYPNTAAPSPTPTGSSILGVFEGSTPCDSIPRPLPQIPANTGCEQMTWKLTLYHATNTRTPTTFKLESAYGLSQPNT